jgi:hypothetical protein
MKICKYAAEINYKNYPGEEVGLEESDSTTRSPSSAKLTFVEGMFSLSLSLRTENEIASSTVAKGAGKSTVRLP